MILFLLSISILIGFAGLARRSRPLTLIGMIGSLSIVAFLILRLAIGALLFLFPAISAALLFAAIIAVCIWAEHKMNSD
jgi:hypothetical protein